MGFFYSLYCLPDKSQITLANLLHEVLLKIYSKNEKFLQPKGMVALMLYICNDEVAFSTFKTY